MMLDTLARALASARGADEIELAALGGRHAATRFAASVITQASTFEDPVVQARAAIGRRVGVARGGLAAVADVIASAIAAARVAPEVQSFRGFAEPVPYPPVGPAFEAATAALTPADHVRSLEQVFLRAAHHGMGCAGAFKSGAAELAVANSRGVRAHHQTSFAHLEIIASRGEASGWAGFYGRDAAGLDAAALCERACGKALAMREPLDLPPGAYDVVLEPAAVVESLEWIAMTAFGARDVEQGRSFLAGREGQTVTGAGVTWTDDALAGDEGVPPIPFDSEGVPKSRVAFVQTGRAGRPCHDLRSAARAGVASTGHAAPPTAEEAGAVASHVQMAPGGDSREDLLARVERGLLVTRFHYVNGLLDPRRALQTGMTRDGLFLIERGQVTRGVRNLRWTESMLEAFARMDGATRERQAVATSWVGGSAGFIAPTVLLRDFHFTGTSR